jgi:uncharacterized protein DUF1194
MLPRKALAPHTIGFNAAWLPFLSALLFLVGSFSASAQTAVDLALVLAVDVSPSMELDEQELQRQGFSEAFRSTEVHNAIRKGAIGRIAVMYVVWAETSLQEIVVPWTVIEHPADGFRFSARLAGPPIRRGRHTSILGAIDFGVRKLHESQVRASRPVIDISGDGVNNQGRMVTKARDEAIAHDIAINGLPIMLKRPDPDGSGLESLDRYFRECVIGGPGAFLIPVRQQGHLAEAIREKIVREVADLPQPQSLFHLARDERSRCFHDPCSEEGSFC